MTVHDFNESLKSALTYDNKELLVQACQEFFLTFDHMTYYERYSKHPSNFLQGRRGVDWGVSLKDPNGHGRMILIDDKVSRYPDDRIFLEAWGDKKRLSPDGLPILQRSVTT